MRKQRAFASLTEQEINQVAEWVKGGKYDDAIERIAKPRPEGFGIKVSRSPLQRLWAKTARVERINARIASGQRLTLNEFDAINAGEKADLAEEIHQAILEDTHALATSGENTPAQLLALQRLADFPERAELRAQRAELQVEMHDHKIEMDLHRKHIATERLQLEKERLALAREKAKTAPAQPREDRLGPLARNWKEVGERICRQFNISPEEAARRKQLNRLRRQQNAAANSQSDVAQTSAQTSMPDLSNGSVVTTLDTTQPVSLPEPTSTPDQPFQRESILQPQTNNEQRTTNNEQLTTDN